MNTMDYYFVPICINPLSLLHWAQRHTSRALTTLNWVV